MAEVLFTLQDDEVRALLDILRFGSPVDGPLKRALDTLERGLQEATTDVWVKLAKGDWVDVKGTPLRVEVVKTLRAITPGLTLKASAEMSAEFVGGRWLEAGAARHLSLLFPGLLVITKEAPGGALNWTDDQLVAYYRENPQEGFFGNTCGQCLCTANVPSNNLCAWTCPCGHQNNTAEVGIHANPKYGPSGARVKQAIVASEERPSLRDVARDGFGIELEEEDLFEKAAEVFTPARQRAAALYNEFGLEVSEETILVAERKLTPQEVERLSTEAYQRQASYYQTGSSDREDL
jgi:hypothetical protein